MSKSTIERAIKVVLERFSSLKTTVGCSHTETLTTLRELVVLHMKLKSHSRVVSVLLETTIAIIEKEKNSKKLHEAAKTMGSMYSACGLADQGHEMIQQLRLQIITGSASSEKSSFKLDRSVGKVCYVFLVTFEQMISGHLTASYSETMADLLTETVLYESFTRSISKSHTDVILARAANLRAFLVPRKRKVQIDGLERQAHEIFFKKWGSSLKVGSGISLIFCVSLLEELGHHDTHNVKIGHSACISSVAKVESLLEDDKTQQAYEVALCALNFISQQRAYHDLQNVGYGLKLSTLMAGRGLGKPRKPGIDPKLRTDMMELSRRIIREVIQQACKDSKIDFVRLQLRELNELAGLLGEQQNHIDLEVSSSHSGPYHRHHTHTTLQWLLKLLWSSREVQKKWSSTTIISIGRRYVQATYANKDHRSRAIRLCEDICYNLRRVWGALDPKTLEMSELLSQLYTSMGHHREAMGVHENILRLVAEGDDGDDRTVDTMDSKRVKMHVEWLKQCYLRLQGWDKSAALYRDLLAAILRMEEYRHQPEWQGVPGTDHWDTKESASDTVGTFVVPSEWEFADPDTASEHADATGPAPSRRSGMAMKRATSNWGLNYFQHSFQSDHEERPGNAHGANPPHAAKFVGLDGDDDGFESAAEDVDEEVPMGRAGAHGVRA